MYVTGGIHPARCFGMINQYERTCWKPPFALPATHEWWSDPAITRQTKPNASVATATRPSRRESRDANSRPATSAVEKLTRDLYGASYRSSEGPALGAQQAK